MISQDYIHGKPMEIGNEVQYLFDDHIVEDRWKLTRRAGKIIKYIHNPVLYKTKPWESGAAAAVLYDPEAGKYKAWYTCFSVSGYFDPKKPSYYVCYAESQDGFEWEKPLFDDFPFGEWDHSNVVYIGRTGLDGRAHQVLFNPDRSDPDKRFMMVTNKVDLAYSPDGIHWKPAEKPLILCGSDTANHLVWVEEMKLWHLYLRPPVRPVGASGIPEGRRHIGRRVAVTTSRDLQDWSLIRTLMYADEREDHDIDSTHVFRRNGVFFCLYDNMHQETGQSEKELRLATSRDGINWDRTWSREVFVPRGPEGHFDAGQIHAPHCDPVEAGDDHLFYYGASPVGQAEWDRESGCGIFRLRKNRFVGQHADEAHGYLLTRQFVLQGSRLEINCHVLPLSYKDPDIRVEILEYPDLSKPHSEWDRKVPGFTLEDCDPVMGDRLDYVVTWNGSPDLSGLKGRKVYLRFRIHQAALYSFRIVP